jgi:hypothetical protein
MAKSFFVEGLVHFELQCLLTNEYFKYEQYKSCHSLHV